MDNQTATALEALARLQAQQTQASPDTSTAGTLQAATQTAQTQGEQDIPGYTYDPEIGLYKNNATGEYEKVPGHNPMAGDDWYHRTGRWIQDALRTDDKGVAGPVSKTPEAQKQ